MLVLVQVVEADVIVHVVDVSSPSREKQESAVSGVLGEMGVDDKPRLTLWNKLDLLPEEDQVMRSCMSCSSRQDYLQSHDSFIRLRTQAFGM